MRIEPLLFAILLGNCSPADPAQAAPGPETRHVLFVGNSLTYTNDLPATVAAIARDNGDRYLVMSAAEPNLALIDHLNGMSAAPQLLRDSSWTDVILQQGPTTTAMCRDSMAIWTALFDPLITKAGARSITLMTWPAASQGDVWDAAHGTAVRAAAGVHGTMAPAGDAWHLALIAHPGLPLYGPDGFHPSEMGTFLTALVVYARLSGRDARSLTPHAFANGATRPMGADTLSWLQSAAASANTATAAQPSASTPVAPAQPQAPGVTHC